MIVVDTNIVAYHVIPGARGGATEKLAQLDPIWTAPLLWRSEFRNVLASAIRRGIMSVEAADSTARRAAGCLLGGEHSITDHAVLKLVAQSKCTAYDCEFVALAMALDTMLVTDDRVVLQAFPKQCRSLDEAIRRGVKP